MARCIHVWQWWVQLCEQYSSIFLCSRRGWETIVVRGSVQHITIAALRKKEKTNPCKRMTNVSKRRSEYFGFESCNCSKSGVLRSLGAVLNRTKKDCLALCQHWASHFHLADSVDSFVYNFIFEGPRALFVLLSEKETHCGWLIFSCGMESWFAQKRESQWSLEKTAMKKKDGEVPYVRKGGNPKNCSGSEIQLTAFEMQLCNVFRWAAVSE